MSGQGSANTPASLPVPPPVPSLNFGTVVVDGKSYPVGLSPSAMLFLQKLWAGVQGQGGALPGVSAIFDMSGDATITTKGVITVAKTKGVPFAKSATVDTTNAGNISAGTLSIARLPDPFDLEESSSLLGFASGVPAFAQVITLGANLSMSGTVLSASGGATAPTLVQNANKRIQASTAGSLTLGATPGVGNILIYMASGFTDVSSTAPAGFTLFQTVTNGNQQVTLWQRTVVGGDGTTWALSGTSAGGISCGLFEFANLNDIRITQSTPTTAGAVSTAPCSNVSNAITVGVTEIDNINGYSSISGASLLLDGTNSFGGTSNHPSVWANQFPGLGNYSVTWTSSTLNNITHWLIQFLR